MSKSKYGNSNLYMTTDEFAQLVVDALHEQNYFKKGDTAHPQDIAYAFTTVGETIGSAMYWAIQQEHKLREHQSTVTTNTEKVSPNVTVTYTSNSFIADSESGYSEWKNKK